MESSQIGALGVVRLIGGCCIIFGLLDAGLYLTEYFIPMLRHHHPAGPINVLRLVSDSVPLIIGVVILVKARALADWLADIIQ